MRQNRSNPFTAQSEVEIPSDAALRAAGISVPIKIPEEMDPDTSFVNEITHPDEVLMPLTATVIQSSDQIQNKGAGK